MTDRPSSVAVIGAGVAGLVAAYRLLQGGHRVHVFEAEASVGGLMRSFEAGGERLECFYHHLFTSDGAAIRLLDELDLLDTIVWRRSTVGVFYGDRIYPFTSTVDLLRFSPLAVRHRIRLGLIALRLRRERSGLRFDDISAVEWVRRHAGQRCLEVVWEPLLRGKFGDRADQVPMTWLWNRLRLRFSSRGLLSQTEVLGYQLGSFAVWIEALVKLIRALGGEILTNEPIARISLGNGRLRLDTGSGRSHYFDAVIATIGSRAFQRIAPPLDERYTEILNNIAYQDALCLVLSLKQPLSNFYWLNINDRSLPFLAVVEHTNLIEAERYGGERIVYVSNYLSRESHLLQMTSDELFSLYVPHLKRINPAFDESWVTGRWLFHGPDAQPVFTVGARRRVADHRTPIPGLYLANTAQIYPQDRSQNYSILMGEDIAKMVAGDLSLAETAQHGI